MRASRTKMRAAISVLGKQMWKSNEHEPLNLNQRESLRFSENCLNFSQYSTSEKIQLWYIDWIELIFTDSQRHTLIQIQSAALVNLT